MHQNRLLDHILHNCVISPGIFYILWITVYLDSLNIKHWPISWQIVRKDIYCLFGKPFVNAWCSNQMSPYNKWQAATWPCERGYMPWDEREAEWCMYISETRVYEERGTFFYLLSKCLQRCKGGCEGPWHQPPRLTDWKQGFIFSNLWSQRRETSGNGRGREGREYREKPWEVK